MKEKGTHRINAGVVDPGPALGLLWLRTNLSWDGPYVRIAGAGFHFIVIFEPVLGAVLIRQTLRLLGVADAIWVDGVRASCRVLEHHLEANKITSSR